MIYPDNRVSGTADFDSFLMNPGSCEFFLVPVFGLSDGFFFRAETFLLNDEQSELL